jgi:hypothetical protein
MQEHTEVEAASGLEIVSACRYCIYPGNHTTHQIQHRPYEATADTPTSLGRIEQRFQLDEPSFKRVPANLEYGVVLLGWQ